MPDDKLSAVDLAKGFRMLADAWDAGHRPPGIPAMMREGADKIEQIQRAASALVEHTRMPSTGDSSDASSQEAVWVKRLQLAINE